MLTTVILEGPMGKAFGREWRFAVDSPSEALKMVEANKPGVFNWIRANLRKYSKYKVVCEYEDGRVECLDQDEYQMLGRPAKIRFVPLVEGRGGAFKAILGIVLIVVGVIFDQPWMVKMGAMMAISGVVELLSPRPSKNSKEAEDNKASYYFNGAANTTTQGVPVQLIYGRVMAGSHVISAALTVDQLM